MSGITIGLGAGIMRQHQYGFHTLQQFTDIIYNCPQACVIKMQPNCSTETTLKLFLPWIVSTMYYLFKSTSTIIIIIVQTHPVDSLLVTCLIIGRPLLSGNPLPYLNETEQRRHRMAWRAGARWVLFAVTYKKVTN